MKDIHDWNPIRVPVKLVEGQWEFFYGGGLPIKDGAIGDLLVDRAAITDKKFLSLLNRVSKHKILEAGTDLLVALTVKPETSLNDALTRKLLSPNNPTISLDASYYFTPRSPQTRFVRIFIDGPTEGQKKRDPTEKGGVWLHLKGLEPNGISTSKVRVRKKYPPRLPKV